MIAPEDQIWNRAALESGGDNPRAGDRALAAVLLAHGLVSNGGVHHAIDCLDEDDLAAAADGFTFLELSEVSELFRNLPFDPLLAEWTDETEAIANEMYSAVVPDDAVLQKRFKAVLRAKPELFSPVRDEG